MRNSQNARRLRGGDPAFATETQLAEMHEETHQQILLGKTGTAARTVEYSLMCWVRKEREQEIVEGTERLVFYRLYKAVRLGIEYGEESVERLSGLRTQRRRTLTRIAIPAWNRRPGVMTARSHLLAIPLCRILRDLRALHPDRGDDWEGAIQHHAASFLRYFRKVVARLHDDSGRSAPADTQHLREIAQLRLTYALVYRDARLDLDAEHIDEVVASDPCLVSPTIDIDAHATWLREHGRADGNVIASITCPAYVTALEGLDGGYEDLVRAYPWLPGRDAVDWMDMRFPGFRDLRERERVQER